jgi:hypothetical protein
MMPSMVMATGREIRPAERLSLAALIVLLLFGFFWVESTDLFIAYMIVTITAITPLVLWLRIGAPGIPVFPVVSAIHYIYFAVPILRQNTIGYEPWDVMRASFTVVLFLASATLGWWLILGSSVRHSRERMAHYAATPRFDLVIFGGLGIGLVFELLIKLGFFGEIGSYFGIVRSVAITATSISCYLLGHCRGRRLLRGIKWHIALAAVGLLIVLSWSSLYLVAGLIYVMAAVLGYVITTKRVPWKSLVPVFAIIFVLHAGKGEMRGKYWNVKDGSEVSTTDVPGLLIEWFSAGIDAIRTGRTEQNFIDRASLMYILLRVQHFTPDQIPFFDGKTYMLLPQFLVPRFLNPDKPTSQTALAMLNIRYGLQTRVTSRSTTIGWGVISEAFANFGYNGVVGVALIYGALAGLFTRISVRASPLGLATLLSVAALITMINLEADLAYLLTNLFQALISGTAFFLLLKFLKNVNKGSAGNRVRHVAQS